ncbi:MAG TPA: response regulator [Chitinophagaceae bacterium]
MLIKSLLLVDDDEDDHELFKLALLEYEYPVAFEGTGDVVQALKRLDDSTITPDLIFLDINMPALNGFEFLRQLKGKKHLKDIPVIMYSTSDSQFDKHKAIEAGAAAYLHKPSTLRELGRLLRHVLNALQGDTMGGTIF